MAWFIPLDAVTLWTVGVIVAIFITVGIVCLVRGLEERKWPEAPGEVVSFTQRPSEEEMQYYPTLRILRANGLPREVTVTRGWEKSQRLVLNG